MGRCAADLGKPKSKPPFAVDNFLCREAILEHDAPGSQQIHASQYLLCESGIRCHRSTQPTRKYDSLLRTSTAASPADRSAKTEISVVRSTWRRMLGAVSSTRTRTQGFDSGSAPKAGSASVRRRMRA